MSDRQTLIDQLVFDEGLKLRPYQDSVGKLTIGVGRNLIDKGISSREAFDLLDHDLDECITDLAATYPWFLDLDAVRQRVVVNMRFNLGPQRFAGFRMMLLALEQGDYVQAKEHMLASKWADQVKGRAQRLARRMATGEDDA